VTGLVTWSTYSSSKSIGLTVGLAIFIFILCYIGGLLGVWLVKKLYINYIPSFMNTSGIKTYTGLRIFWIISGAASAFVVIRVLYHYHGLLGLVLPILLYLPSLAISIWVFVRAMEGSPIHPTRIIYRISIIVAFFITLIFTLWWILEISNGLWGTLGVVIVTIICVCFYSLILWPSFKRIKHPNKSF
jgi:hypothetical protein